MVRDLRFVLSPTFKCLGLGLAGPGAKDFGPEVH